MQIFKTLDKWQTFRKQIGGSCKTIGFVPTMGNLHVGHQRLLEKSVAENELTVLSIFVNPTQFDNPDDLENYPRTLERDKQLAQDIGVDVVFIPEYNALYPDDYQFKIIETVFADDFCEKRRQGHFNGVLTVVLKLLNLVKPTRAYFGEKDFQQYQLVAGMAKAFFLDTKIICCATVRDALGLALSSRNNRLTPEQYALAQQFPYFLRLKLSPEKISKRLTELGFLVDYITDHEGRRFGAVSIDGVRLIDNISLTTCRTEREALC